MSEGLRLYQKHTLPELLAMQAQIWAEKQRKVAGSIHLYDKQTRRKLDAIGWAIYYHMEATHERT